MNFLLHRHFARRELSSAAGGVGSMLPDLWRMADRRMRARADRDLPDAPSPAAIAVQDGVLHHLAADDWFHKTKVFTEGERTLAKALAGVGARKLVLLAHPTWEMCLDGAWLLSQAFDTTLAELRADFADADEQLEEVAGWHRDSDAISTDAFATQMQKLQRGLLDGRWIDSYQSGEGLTRCVAGIRRRFRLPAMTEEEESVTALILEEALDRARDGVVELEKSRSEHLRKKRRHAAS